MFRINHPARHGSSATHPNDLAVQLHWQRWEDAKAVSARADARLRRLRRLHLRDDSPRLMRARAAARAARLAAGKEFRMAAISQEPWGAWGTSHLISPRPAKQRERLLLSFGATCYQQLVPSVKIIANMQLWDGFPHPAIVADAVEAVTQELDLGALLDPAADQAITATQTA